MHEIPEPRERFKWPVAAERTLAAAAAEVWNVISSPGLLPLYHPFCESNPVQHWPGPGAADEIRYFSGRVLQRRVTEWHDGVGFDAEVGREGGGTSAVSWRVFEVAERRTRLAITIYPDSLQQLPVAVRWIPHLTSLKPKLGSYLDSVLRGLEWFVTMRQPVSRNQFGPHPWFSPGEEVADRRSD